MTRYRKCSAKDLQNRLQFINRHLETLNSIKRELLEESELRRETLWGQSQTIQEYPTGVKLYPPTPPALVRQIATRPPSPEVLKGTPPPIEETTPTPEVSNPKGTESIAEPILQFLEDKPEGFEDNISLASNEINNIEQELKESLEKLSLAKMKKTLSRSKPKII